MKSFKYFFGAMLISAGFFWLNHYFNFIEISGKNLHKYWPIYLIIFGLSLLNLPKFLKLIFSFLAGILTTLLIFGGIYYFSNLNELEKQDIENKIEKYFDEDQI
jgi:hypothetical protein